MDYFIAGFQNRGSDDQPFGRLYLSRSSKPNAEIIGSLSVGSHRDNPDPLAIWASNQMPDDVSGLTLERARQYLAERFPHLVKQSVTKPQLRK